MSEHESSLAALYHAALRGLDGIERGTATVPHAARSDSPDPIHRIEATLRAVPVAHLEALALLCEGLAAVEAPTRGNRS